MHKHAAQIEEDSLGPVARSKDRSDLEREQLNVIAFAPDAFGGKGGIAQCSRNFLTALSESNTIGKLSAVIRNRPAYQESIPKKIDICYPSVRNKLLYTITALREAKNIGDLDVVICGHLYLLPVAWLVGRITNTPIILFIHGIEAWSPPKQIFVTRLLQKVDMIVSVSNFTRNRLLQWLPVVESRVTTLHNCIKLDNYDVRPGARKLRENYRVDASLVLMTIARLDAAERYKGIDQVLEVLPSIKNDVPDLVYLIIGEGNDRARLESKAARLGLRDSVIFAGWVEESEKQDFLSIANTFVMPGWGEGFGFVYLEAMACGVPVIASELDGSREAVLNGALGEVVNPHDSAAIKAAIMRCLRKEKRVPEGLEQFDYDVFKKNLIEIVHETKFSYLRKRKRQQ